jgi:hypothetical protein
LLRSHLESPQAAYETFAPVLELAPFVPQFWKEMGDLTAKMGREPGPFYERAEALRQAGF